MRDHIQGMRPCIEQAAQHHRSAQISRQLAFAGDAGAAWSLDVSPCHAGRVEDVSTSHNLSSEGPCFDFLSISLLCTPSSLAMLASVPHVSLPVQPPSKPGMLLWPFLSTVARFNYS